MKRIRTDAIVLARTNFGEADRIVSFLTPENGKVRAIAKGVRRPKSKLAGGIELLSICDVLFFVGKSEIYTVASTSLKRHYGNIVKDMERVTTAYELIKILNKATEDAPEAAYFELLNAGFEALDDLELDPQITALWFNMQLLKLSGHAPNLRIDVNGDRLSPSGTYNFQLDRMQFTPEQSKEGTFTTNHIKFLRLGFAAQRPQVLGRVRGVGPLVNSIQNLVLTMLRTFVPM